MKKFFSCAAVALALFALSACGGGKVAEVEGKLDEAISKLEKASSAEEIAEINANLMAEMKEIGDKLSPEELKEIEEATKDSYEKYAEAVKAAAARVAGATE